MQAKEMLKVLEIMAARVAALETELTVSQYQIDKLRAIVEQAEKEAGQS